MKKTVTVFIVLAFMAAIAAPAFASVPKSMEKLINGAKEVTFSPVEIYDHTKISMDKEDYLAVGFVKGLLTSPFHVLKRAGNGLVDIATFPIE